VALPLSSRFEITSVALKIPDAGRSSDKDKQEVTKVNGNQMSPEL
jgi:hypothetical protein